MERQSDRIIHLERPEFGARRSDEHPPLVQAASASDRGISNADALSITVAATFTVDLLRDPLLFWTQALGIKATVALAPYAQIMQELLDPESVLCGNKKGVSILLIRLEDWVRDRSMQHDAERDLDDVHKIALDFIRAVEALRDRTNASLFVFLCESSGSSPQVYKHHFEKIRNTLNGRLRTLPDVHSWTHSNLARLYPIENYESPLSDRLGHIPYTNEYFALLATLFSRRIAALVKPPFKVIAVDCDNTLWRGVCGEDGPDGVELTPCHLQFQRLLVGQHDAGMLLCLCSKNNPEDVAAVFRARLDMPLREEHFISSRVSWNAKSLSLQSLSEELGLSLDSFIFVDDSALECAEVQAQCPSTLVLHFPDTPEQVSHFLNHVWAFDRVGVTEEARRRTAQYRENRARNAALKQVVGLDEFLTTLELEVEIAPMRPDQLARVAELVQRTNQFNLTTIRRRGAEIEDLVNAGELQGLAVRVRDRFGDYGLTGAVLFHYEHGSLDVDTFVLSCRVLGRGVEHRIVSELGRLAEQKEVPVIILRYRQTARNQPARNFLESSFSQFAAPLKSDEGVSVERIFKVPTAYAESLRPQVSTVAAEEETVKSVTSSALAATSSATTWHDFAYRLSHVVDIVTEFARHRSTARRSSREYLAPRTSTERAVAKIWTEILAVETVGLQDDFFELGGDSLLAVQSIARIGSALGRELALTDFFEAPVVERIAAKLDGLSRPNFPLRRAERRFAIPLSSAQRRLWFIERLNGGSVGYHICEAARLHGSLDQTALRSALDTLIERHETLRSVFAEVDGAPVQNILPQVSFALQSIDLSGLFVEEREAAIRAQMAHEIAAPFDLTTGPLIRGRLLALSDHESVLVIVMHHIISDGWSIGVVFRELSALYSAFFRGAPNPLPPLPAQYADYVLWQQERTSGPFLGEQLRYWKEHLEGAPEVLELPTDRVRPATQSYRGASISVSLGPELTVQLKALSQRLNLTLPMTLYAGWAIVLWRLSGQDDIVVGMPVANRLRTELEELIGFFVNTLAVRFRLSYGLPLSELLQHVKETMLAAYAHQDVPFEQVVELLQPARSLSHSPVFQVLFVLQNTPARVLELAGLNVTRVEPTAETAQFDLCFSLQESGGSLSGTLNYATDLFDRATVERWARHFEYVMAQIAQGVSLTIDDLQLISQYDGRRLLEAFNEAPRSGQDEGLIHELFSNQTARTPHTVAVVCDGKSLTYAELNARANQLARTLREEGVGAEHVVGLCVERSLDMMVGILGILKAGGAYLPLDPAYPPDRLAYLLADAKPRVLLTQEHLSRRLPETTTKTIALDRDWSSIARQDARELHPSLLPRSNQLAYVIYTSGSTGQPKGVLVEHGNVVNHWRALDGLYREPFDCRQIGLNASISFDASVQQWVQLLCGCTLFIVPQAARLDADLFFEFLQQHQIEGIDCTPSQLSIWVAAGLLERKAHGLRTVLVGGEAIDPTLWGWLARCSDVAFHNVYGPTECTVDSTAGTLRGLSTVPHIGRPLRNTRVYILDNSLRAVPIGVAAEIYVSGKGVARGYLSRPELTAERFPPDPFSTDLQTRMYKTGDLGKWRPDGVITYLGRNDHQVKIRGVRIELGEIEVQLCRQEQVKEAVVIAREDTPGERRLVAYVIPNDRQIPNVETLRAYLGEVLPEPMVPGAFVMLERLPLTPSGKLDRRALPIPAPEAFVSRQYAAPEGEIEQHLASIWRDLLQVDQIGRDHNFFEMGGYSLLVIKLLFRINQIFDTGLTVADVYKSPTIRQLALRITGNTIADELVDLANEAYLDEAIVAAPGIPRAREQITLLTGCTGFVGRFLLTQLLEDTDATIYCLVRARSPQDAVSRLRGVLVKWDLWKEGFEQRMVPIPGDLRLPRLGIDESLYRKLCQEVDTIYHCASSMNHLETYAMARPANVDSTTELLRLATQNRSKLVNYVSTLSIFSPHTADIARLVREDSPIEEEKHLTSHGYLASKWVSEKMFKIADERGVPCNIFRLGLVWADSQQGRYDEAQREYRVLKSCLLSGYGIRSYRYEMDPTPVDYVAQAIVFLSNQHRNGHGVFHIASPSPKVEALFERCNEIGGTELTLVSYYEWICRMRDLHLEGRSLPVLPLIEYAFSMDEQTFHADLRSNGFPRVRFDCGRTHEELEQAAIKAPILDDDLLKGQLTDMLSRDPQLRRGHARGSASRTRAGYG